MTAFTSKPVNVHCFRSILDLKNKFLLFTLNDHTVPHEATYKLRKGDQKRSINEMLWTVQILVSLIWLLSQRKELFLNVSSCIWDSPVHEKPPNTARAITARAISGNKMGQ